MRMRHTRLIIAAVTTMAIGGAGGMALAQFVTGPLAAPPGSDAGFAMVQDAGNASGNLSTTQPAEASSDAGQVPENYVCKGCGPTLAQMRMQAAAAPYAPMPAEHADDAQPLPDDGTDVPN